MASGGDHQCVAAHQSQEKVNELCQVMIKKEEISSEFRKTTLHMIYKGKGKHEDLSKNRFIHSKSWFPRLVVEGALKKSLVEKSSIFQIGGQPNHRPEELLFVMKSVMHCKTKDEGKRNCDPVLRYQQIF